MRLNITMRDVWQAAWQAWCAGFGVPWFWSVQHLGFQQLVKWPVNMSTSTPYKGGVVDVDLSDLTSFSLVDAMLLSSWFQ